MPNCVSDSDGCLRQGAGPGGRVRARVPAVGVGAEPAAAAGVAAVGERGGPAPGAAAEPAAYLSEAADGGRRPAAGPARTHTDAAGRIAAGRSHQWRQT